MMRTTDGSTEPLSVLDQVDSGHLAEQFEVLHGLCHAYGSSPHTDELFASLGRWIRTAMGAEPDLLVVALPDGANRLQEVHSTGRGVGGRSERMAGRRRAHSTKARAITGLPEDELAAAALPLVSRGAVLGIVEVVAPAWRIEGIRLRTLEAIVSQTAIVMSNILGRTQDESASQALTQALLGDLLRVWSPEEALRTTLGHFQKHFGSVGAAWLSAPGDGELGFAESAGLGPEAMLRLGSRVPSLRPWRAVPPEVRDEVESAFAEVTGAQKVAVVDATEAVIMIGGAPEDPAVMDEVRTLLHDTLGRLHALESARMRTEALDLGLACTAHEFRGSIAAVKHVIELLLRGTGSVPLQEELLQQSKSELDRLASVCGSLLRWGIESEPLSTEDTDLVALVEEAVRSCKLETGEDRIHVRPNRTPLIKADRDHLRGAIVNGLRSSLRHSPKETTVDVVVDQVGDAAKVDVHDRGSSAESFERASMFDPFVGSDSLGAARASRSLELFIARRVVEAHGGSMAASSRPDGLTLHIELPMLGHRQ